MNKSPPTTVTLASVLPSPPSACPIVKALRVILPFEVARVLPDATTKATSPIAVPSEDESIVNTLAVTLLLIVTTLPFKSSVPEDVIAVPVVSAPPVVIVPTPASKRSISPNANAAEDKIITFPAPPSASTTKLPPPTATFIAAGPSLSRTDLPRRVKSPAVVVKILSVILKAVMVLS